MRATIVSASSLAVARHHGRAGRPRHGRSEVPMGLFSRKKPTTARSQAPGGFHLVVQVGDDTSERMVAKELLDQLVRATKQPALGALDRRFGGEAWCWQISTHTSLEGPVVYFSLDINIPPGRTMADVSDIVSAEFRRRWAAAAERLLQ
jgi:hypothetical protein